MDEMEAEANSGHSGLYHGSLSSFLCAERCSQKVRLRLQHSAAVKASKTDHSAKLITDPELIIRLLRRLSFSPLISDYFLSSVVAQYFLQYQNHYSFLNPPENSNCVYE